MGKYNVSVNFFCAAEKCLRRRCRGRGMAVSPATLNRWVQLLGRVETEYAALAKAHREKSK